MFEIRNVVPLLCQKEKQFSSDAEGTRMTQVSGHTYVGFENCFCVSVHVCIAVMSKKYNAHQDPGKKI